MPGADTAGSETGRLCSSGQTDFMRFAKVGGMSDQDRKNRPRPVVSFSLPQILGGALAAATAATIGSTLGTAGTIIGAALASVIGGVGGTLYAAGIDRGGRGAWTAMRKGYARIVSDKPDDQDAPNPGTPAAAEPPETEHDDPRHDDEPTKATVLIGMAAAAKSAENPGPQASTDSAGGKAESTGPRQQRPSRKRLIWAIGGSVAAAALIFVIAFAAITGVELAKGSSLSGGKGTTVSHIVNPSRASSSPTPKPTKKPSATSSPIPAPTPSDSGQPAPQPSDTATSEPTATDQPSDTPSPDQPTEPTPSSTDTETPA